MKKKIFINLICILLSFISYSAENNTKSILRPYPVIGLFKDTLFNIYVKEGSFSVEERANAITERITKISKEPFFKKEKLKLDTLGSDIEITYNDLVIINISVEDAKTLKVSQGELANKYKSLIEKEILNYHEETSFIRILKEIGLAILTISIVITILYFNRKLFRLIDKKITLEENKKIKGIQIKNYTLLDVKKELHVILNINRFIKWCINILIVYISLPILFGIFPWTKNLANILFSYILNPIKNIGSSIWNYIPNLITIIIIFLVFKYIIKGLHYLKAEIEVGNLKINGFYPDWANSTYQIMKILVYAFMFIVIFPYLPGSDSTVFKGVSVFLGVLFSFGSAGSLSNIIAGLVITYMRLFKIGDRVKIGDVVGDIIEKTLLVTRVRTIKNEIISIPNSSIMNSHTLNYSSDAPDNGLILHSTVTIGYDVSWKEMHQYLIDAALRTNLIEKKPLPFVLQTSLDDFYVSYQINAYTKAPNKQALIYSELHQNIQDICNENRIEIMSPHFRGVRDGNNVNIPNQYKPSDYKAPHFNVNIKG
ncbi:mechanosensitive ion channel family protein [Crocinitomicaceae bacterium]|nr:mechanosensitive ion channel family protein [Crocinitomicaceae bacterium]